MSNFSGILWGRNESRAHQAPGSFDELGRDENRDVLIEFHASGGLWLWESGAQVQRTGEESKLGSVY